VDKMDGLSFDIYSFPSSSASHALKV